MDMRLKSRAGFTLLELLMVVIIVGILVSIALPQFLRAAERSRASEALSVLGAIRSAENRYVAMDPGGSYALTAQICAMDIDVPGCPPNPPSALWTYTLPAGPCTQGPPNPGCNVVAQRVAGVAAAGTISIDLDSGVTCADNAINAGIWGVGVPPC